MNQRKAFEDTLSLAAWRGMPDSPGSTLGFAHISDMYSRIEDGFSESKLGRWLGWAQCAVVASGVATLEEMKEINLRNSDD
jgi:hypothetical protein